MGRRLWGVVTLALVWVALWGDLSFGNVVAGLLVGALVLLVLPVPTPRRDRSVSVPATVRYLLHFLRELVVATAEVARQVFWPVERLEPGVVRVELRSRDEGLVSLVANTISLTPGTLTLEADPARGLLWVHALHLPDGREEGVVQGAHRLEDLGARALGVPLERRDGAPRPGGGTTR